MTSKELLIQEIETLPPELVSEALDLIRSLTVNYTKNKLEPVQQEFIPVTDSTETAGDKEQLTYRPASGRSILRHAGTWEGDDFEECLQSVYATRGKAKFDDENPFE
ncbi:hypothetical protein WA1_04660 [Scytonema hofmannii PCC 7110]|uniref:DUF2281 domain-containing protein n=1 Tax=Scytonema hofmannii PCC 7110 TaxID=128403 RepID=A0A139WZB7_9CYAN|nr:hypothetical protein [Scytonema hofmannii]KYC37807.1 hypothetical protein WA1_04660 [Scytonema hofmannii PCC 7110]